MTNSVVIIGDRFMFAPSVRGKPCGKSAAKRSPSARSNSLGRMSRWSTAMPNRAWTVLKEYMGGAG